MAMWTQRYSVAYWQPRIAPLLGDDLRDAMPQLLAWIAEESGGNPAGLGEPYEVGIFQLDLQDGPAWGASIATLHGNFTASATSQDVTRWLTDDEEQLQVTSGLAYVRHARSVALGELDRAGLSWSDADTWSLTKLQHGLPGLPYSFLPAAAAAGQASSWTDFRAYVEGLSAGDAQNINANVARWHSQFSHLLDNAERVGNATPLTDTDSADGLASFDVLLLLAAIAAAAFALTRLL